MRNVRRSSLSVLAALAAALGGLACQEDDQGTPPTLEMVSLSGDGVEIGVASVVMGQGEFTDPDGDVEEAEIELRDPNGGVTGVTTPLVGVSGQTEAAFAIQLQITPIVAGTYEATFVLVDAKGNESEPEQATFEVEE